MQTRRGRRATWLLAMAAVVGVPAALPAQDIIVGGQLDPVVSDTFLVLVPYRPMDEIRSELEQVREGRRLAEAERRRSEDLERRVDGAIEVQKREIELLKSREEFAKKEKREADRAAERARRQQAELTRSMLERRKALRETETAVAEAEREAAETRQKALEHELSLAQKREEYGRLPVSDTAQARLIGREVSQLERRTLDARADAAGKEREHAQRAQTLAQRRLSLHDAQQKLSGNDR